MMIKSYLTKILTSVFILIGFIILPTKSDAQFYFGGKAGPAMTNVMGDFPGNNFELGYSSGGTIGVAMGDDQQFNIQADLLISLKGLNQKYVEKSIAQPSEQILSETTTQYDNDLNLTYFELPITFRYNLSIGGGVFPYHSSSGPVDINFFAGPYVGYLLNASASFNTTQKSRVVFYDDQGNQTNEDVTSSDVEGGKFRVEGRNAFGIEGGSFGGSLDTAIANMANIANPTLSSGLNKLDVGVTGGIGISFEVGDHSKLSVEGRYSYGLFSIDKKPGYFNDVDIEIQTNDQGLPTGVDVSRTKANLKNVMMAAYVGWTYTIPSNTF